MMMNTPSMLFLGLPQFAQGSAPVSLTRAKGIALLLYLAVTRVAQPRDRVLDLLWPESLPQAARKNMRNTLWAIGEAFGEDVLEHDGTTLRLADNVQVDIHTLEDGVLLLSSSAVAGLEAAAATYRGPLADGLVVHEAPDFELWLTIERERLATMFLTLLERIVKLTSDAGNWQAVIAHAERALLVDPLRESMHLALMEAHARQGQRAQVAQRYTALTDVLQRELGVAPLPATTARYEALLAAPTLIPAPPQRTVDSDAPLAPFVGRGDELAILDAELARAAHGTARVVLISGDLGIGKTQLWRTWAATRAAHVPVLATYALETHEPVPFGPLLTLFRQPGLAHALLQSPSALAPIWLTELARLLPELATRWPNATPLALSPAEERARLLQALTEVVRVLAQSPLILVIDDLHWADPSTLDWLVYLTDHLRDTPLLVIGTYRTQDAAERLASLVAGWQRQARVRSIALPHLTEDESLDLLRALGGADAAAGANDLVHQSGGNPYFLIELQRTPHSGRLCDLASLIRARLEATVPTFATQVLQAAAVLGDQMDLVTLAATSGRSEEATLDALDALVDAAILDPQESTYRFIHPFVAEVVRQNMSPMRRAFLYRRAAEALEQATPERERILGTLTDFFAAAGEPLRAAHYAERAATQALAVGAFVEAATYARRAVQWEPTPQRHLVLGEALAISGSAEETQAQLHEALRGFDEIDDAVGATQTRILLARRAIATTEPDRARDWIAHAPLDRAAINNPTLSAQAHLLVATVERQNQQYDAAAAQLAQAEQLVQGEQRPAFIAQIAFEYGNLLANRGELQASLNAFAQAIQYAQQYSNPVFETMARNNLAFHTLLVGDLQGAQVHIRLAAALIERHAFGFLQQYVESTAGEIALAAGDLVAADAALTRAYAAAHDQQNRVHMANIRVNQARVAQARHDQTTARALLVEAHSLFGASVDAFVRAKLIKATALLAENKPHAVQH